jgi:hypothetical protein
MHDCRDQGTMNRFRVTSVAIAASLCVGAIISSEAIAQAPASTGAAGTDAHSASALAAVCVQCSGPEATYRCAVKDSQHVNRIRGSSRALEFVCITELAKAGGHQSCRAGNSFAGPCIGEERLIDLAASGDGAVAGGGRAGGAPAETGAPPQNSPRATGGKSDHKPPQTLEELARITVSKSKKQIAEADEKVQEAGSAVGKALKKSWACLSSLFTECK